MVYTIEKSYNPETHNTTFPLWKFLDEQRDKNKAECVHRPCQIGDPWIYHYNGATVKFYKTEDPKPHGNLFFRLHLHVSSKRRRLSRKIFTRLERLALKQYTTLN